MRQLTIKNKLIAFSDWFNDDDAWYTRRGLARIIICAESSISAAIGWLRRNGFIVTAIWVWEDGHYIYNVKRGDTSILKARAKRSAKDLDNMQKRLKARLKKNK